MKLHPKFVIPLIVAITAAPFVSAWFLVNYTQVGHSEAPGHGTLIDPPRQLADAALNGAGDAARLHGKWSLLYLSEGECGSTCLDSLKQLRELRAGTGREMHRVQCVLVSFSQTRVPEDLCGRLLAADPAVFALVADDKPLGAGRIYLVDPLGNLFMAYPAGTDSAGIIRDLKRLLRYSRIG